MQFTWDRKATQATVADVLSTLDDAPPATAPPTDRLRMRLVMPLSGELIIDAPEGTNLTEQLSAVLTALVAGGQHQTMLRTLEQMAAYLGPMDMMKAMAAALVHAADFIDSYLKMCGQGNEGDPRRPFTEVVNFPLPGMQPLSWSGEEPPPQGGVLGARNRDEPGAHPAG